MLAAEISDIVLPLDPHRFLYLPGVTALSDTRSASTTSSGSTEASDYFVSEILRGAADRYILSYPSARTAADRTTARHAPSASEAVAGARTTRLPLTLGAPRTTLAMRFVPRRGSRATMVVRAPAPMGAERRPQIHRMTQLPISELADNYTDEVVVEPAGKPVSFGVPKSGTLRARNPNPTTVLAQAKAAPREEAAHRLRRPPS